MKNVDKENIKTQEIKGKERTTITAKPKKKYNLLLLPLEGKAEYITVHPHRQEQRQFWKRKLMDVLMPTERHL